MDLLYEFVFFESQVSPFQPRILQRFELPDSCVPLSLSLSAQITGEWNQSVLVIVFRRPLGRTDTLTS